MNSFAYYLEAANNIFGFIPIKKPDFDLFYPGNDIAEYFQEYCAAKNINPENAILFNKTEEGHYMYYFYSSGEAYVVVFRDEFQFWEFEWDVIRKASNRNMQDVKRKIKKIAYGFMGKTKKPIAFRPITASGEEAYKQIFGKDITLLEPKERFHWYAISKNPRTINKLNEIIR
jgi:hypothetical protein